MGVQRIAALSAVRGVALRYHGIIPNVMAEEKAMTPPSRLRAGAASIIDNDRSLRSQPRVAGDKLPDVVRKQHSRNWCWCLFIYLLPIIFLFIPLIKLRTSQLLNKRTIYHMVCIFFQPLVIKVFVKRYKKKKEDNPRGGGLHYNRVGSSFSQDFLY